MSDQNTAAPSPAPAPPATTPAAPAPDSSAAPAAAPAADAPAAAPAAAPGAAPAQPPAPAPAVPDKYDFKMPDGIEVDAEQAEAFSGIAKELGLTQEQAQKIADLQASAVQKQVAAHAATVQGWRDAVTNDKDLGGDKLTESTAVAKKAIELAPPELRTEFRSLLDSTGMGNHPVVFKFLHAVGKLVAEDGVIKANPTPEKKPFYEKSNMVR